MAYFKTKQDQDQLARMNSLGPTNQAQGEIQQNQAGATQQGAPQPTATSSGSPEQAPSVKSATAPKGSGMGADIRKYISQNQASGIESGVNQSIQKQAQNVGQQVEKQQQSFNQKLTQQRNMQNQAFQSAQSALQQAQGLTGEAQLSEDQVRAYQNALNQKQVGDQLNLSGAQQAMRDFSQSAQAAQSGNKAQLLRQTFGKQGQYTGGQSALDELILGADKQASANIVDTAQQAVEQQQSAISQAQREALRSLGEVNAERQAGKEALQTGAEEAYTGLGQTIQERLNELPTDLREQFQSGQLSEQAIEALGLTDNKLYGLDPLQYLKQVSESSVATQDELARANALAQLRGQEQDIILDPSAVGQEDAYGLEALRNAVAERQQAYESGLSEYEQRQQDINELRNYMSNTSNLVRAGLVGRGFGGLQSGTEYGKNITRMLSDVGLGTDLLNQFQSTSRRKQLGGTNPRTIRSTQFDINKFNQYLQQNVARQNQNRLSALQQQYTPDQILEAYNADAVSAKNGAIKSSKAEMLRKLLG